MIPNPRPIVGRSVADAIRANGDAVLGCLDDGLAAAELVAGAPVPA